MGAGSFARATSALSSLPPLVADARKPPSDPRTRSTASSSSSTTTTTVAAIPRTAPSSIRAPPEDHEELSYGHLQGDRRAFPVLGAAINPEQAGGALLLVFAHEPTTAVLLTPSQNQLLVTLTPATPSVKEAMHVASCAVNLAREHLCNFELDDALRRGLHSPLCAAHHSSTVALPLISTVFHELGNSDGRHNEYVLRLDITPSTVHRARITNIRLPHAPSFHVDSSSWLERIDFALSPEYAMHASELLSCNRLSMGGRVFTAYIVFGAHTSSDMVGL
jgi:hypothetical protein